MADLSGRVVVVTGAGGSLGAGIAEGLEDAGATVFVTGPSPDDSHAPVDGGDAEICRLLERVLAEHGRLDVLVSRLPARESARQRVLATMVAQGHGLLVDLGPATTPPAGATGVTALQLIPRADKPRYSGRCVAALAMDPDVADKSGGVFSVDELVHEYRFSDPAEPIAGVDVCTTVTR